MRKVMECGGVRHHLQYKGCALVQGVTVTTSLASYEPAAFEGASKSGSFKCKLQENCVDEKPTSKRPNAVFRPRYF